MAQSSLIQPSIQNQMIAQLLKQGMDTSPVGHPTQAFARMAQALMGGLEARRVEGEERQAPEEMLRLIQGQQAAPPPPAAPQPNLGPITPGPRPPTAPPAVAARPDATVPIGTTMGQPPPQQAGPSPASVRFNNPGAQYPGPSAQAFGSTGTATIGGGHKIAQFSDPVQGAAAQFHLLGRGYVGMPLAQAIQKWSGGNNSQQYVAMVSRATGLPPDTVITPDLLRSPQGIALAQTMARHEAGRDYPLTPQQWQQAQSMAFNGQQAAPQTPQGSPPPAGAPQGQQQAQVPPIIQQALKSDNPRVRAYGTQLLQQWQTQQMAPPKFHKLNDEMLFDERTGRTQAAGPGFRPLTDPAERARFGIPADDKRPYQVGPGNKLINPPAENRITVDQRGEGAFAQNAAAANAKRYNTLVEGGFEAQSMVADLGALRDIGTRIATGKITQAKAALGPYAEAVGVKIDGLDDMQAYQAIVSKMAPRMRVAGSGATSDFEMRQFLISLPQLGNTPQGNEIITNTLEALQQHRMAAADIGSRALAGEITPREAEKELRALPNPLELWKKSRGSSASGPATPGPGSPSIMESSRTRGQPTPQEIVDELRRRGLAK